MKLQALLQSRCANLGYGCLRGNRIGQPDDRLGAKRKCGFDQVISTLTAQGSPRRHNIKPS
jgi:hypothetical protein